MGQGGADFALMVGSRVRTARKEMELTQEKLSDKLGFKDRQILANIEAGKRKVSAEDMLSLIKLLQKPLEFFTDPYLIAERNLFSWRAVSADNVLQECEEKARKLVSANRRFAHLLEERFSPLFPKLTLTKRSSFEDAANAGETLADQWELDEIPALKLPEFSEKKLDILLLHMDLPEGVSGGACFLQEFKTILINRGESEARRNFDLAHELFHLLTWDTMQPDRIASPDFLEEKKPRVENLANNFAAGLLMPANTLQPLWEKRGELEIHEWLNTTSESFHVSGKALYYRILNLDWLKKADKDQIDTERLGRHSKDGTAGDIPRYSKAFVRRLHDVLERGLVSVRKAVELLDCNIEDIERLFKEYGFDAPFEL